MWPFKRKVNKNLAPASNEEILSRLEALHKKCVNADITTKIRNETQTRYYLIDDFVSSIGFDLLNPESVDFEFPVTLKNTNKKKRVDYALKYKSEENGVASEHYVFVEAKSIGESLTKETVVDEVSKKVIKKGHIDQIRMYFDNCDDAKVIILTNGLQYYFYTRDPQLAALNNKSDSLNNESFYSIDFTKDDYNKDIDELLFLVNNKFNTDNIIQNDVRKAVKKNIMDLFKLWCDAVSKNVPDKIVENVKKGANCSEFYDDEELKKIISELILSHGKVD